MVMLVGCTITEEETIDKGLETYVSELSQQENETNTEEGQAAFYLPPQFEVSETIDEYNIVLEHEEQVYVFFHEPNEPQTSTVLLERDKLEEQEFLLFEEVTTDEYVSFLMIQEEEEDQLLVAVALGGAKVSTLSTYEMLVDDIEAMTEIVQSYETK